MQWLGLPSLGAGQEVLTVRAPENGSPSSWRPDIDRPVPRFQEPVADAVGQVEKQGNGRAFMA
jgi:hypothetical protein